MCRCLDDSFLSSVDVVMPWHAWCLDVFCSCVDVGASTSFFHASTRRCLDALMCFQWDASTGRCLDVLVFLIGRCVDVFLVFLALRLCRTCCPGVTGLFPLPVIAENSWYSLLHVCFASSKSLRWFNGPCTPLRSMWVSVNPRSDFFLLLSQCRNGLLMRFHRIALYLPPSTQVRQRFAVFVFIVPSVHSICVNVLVSILQHFVCFVVHVLPHRWSMSGSMSWILFNDTAGDWQDVVSNLIRLSMPFRRLHTFVEGAEDDANFPEKDQSGHCLLEEISHSTKYCVVAMLVINSFDFSLNGLIFLSLVQMLY